MIPLTRLVRERRGLTPRGPSSQGRGPGRGDVGGPYSLGRDGVQTQTNRGGQQDPRGSLGGHAPAPCLPHPYPQLHLSPASSIHQRSRCNSTPPRPPTTTHVLPGQKSETPHREKFRKGFKHPDACGGGGEGSPKRPTHRRKWRGRGLYSPAPLLSLASCGEKQRKQRLLKQAGSILPEHSLRPAEGRRTGQPTAASLKNRPISNRKVCELLVSPQDHLSAERKKESSPRGTCLLFYKDPKFACFPHSCCLPLQSQGQPFRGTVPTWITPGRSPPPHLLTLPPCLHHLPWLPASSAIWSNTLARPPGPASAHPLSHAAGGPKTLQPSSALLTQHQPSLAPTDTLCVL